MLCAVDPGTWRAASPCWTEDRREIIAAKYVEATNRRPTLDDPDPVGSRRCQYPNRWNLTDTEQTKGEPVVTFEA